MRRRRHDPAGELAAFVADFLAQDRLAGLSGVLAQIADSVGAFGCILWEAGSQSVFKPPPSGTLYVVEEWFQDETLSAIHDLPLDAAVTGTAVLSGRAQVIRNAQTSPRVNLQAGDRFLVKARIGPICSIPIASTQGSPLALTVYGRDREPFSRAEVQRLKRLTSLLPALYQTIRDKVSFRLLSRVKGAFDRMEMAAGESLTPRKKMLSVLQEVCELIAEAFGCLESTIHLEDVRKRPGRFERVATTWLERSPQRHYEAGQDDGLTAWVLANDQPMRIFDLRRFEQEIEVIRSEYPGLRWSGLSRIEQDFAERTDLERKDRQTPLSFMATPIRAGGRLIGSVRCFAVVEGPYYFAQHELDLLKLVGNEIGQRWAAWLRRRNLAEENRSWRALVQSITDLNRFVYEELTGQAPNEVRIFRKALDVAQEVLAGGEITDVRLLDENTNELYFAATYGSLWDAGDAETRRKRKARRFAVDRNRPSSAGAWVVATGRVRMMPDVAGDRFYDGTFPDTKRMIIAPISVEDEVFGVLDIRDVGKAEFPPHAENIAELLGRQLGLYHYLGTTIGRLRSAEAELSAKVAELQKTEEEQSMAYEDLGHQLRSPILQAHYRATAILRENSSWDGAQDSPIQVSARALLAVRGLCGKARRVAMNTRLFVDLARNQPIRLDLTRLDGDRLIRRLIEAASDTEILLEPDRRIRLLVERDTFSILRERGVSVDYSLLEQAISNLLDNAAKYSYSGTKTRIFGGITKSGRFSLSVANRGIRLRPQEVTLSKQRSWRSDDAKMTTGEGSGIGLWLVDSIMKAHGGELVVMPTDSKGWTHVKLVFPDGNEETRR